MSDIEDGFCLPHNDTKFPSELEKATELLPCPFCGEQPVLKIAGRTSYWWVGCEIHLFHNAKGCGVGHSSHAKQVAIDRWNNQPAAKRLKEVEKEIGCCLQHEPLAIRVCEGGGPENICASLALTMAHVRETLKEVEKERDELKRIEGVLCCAASTAAEERDQLRAEYKQALEDKVRMDWLESKKVQLNCCMGAPGNFHYQVGSWPSKHSYRAAIDARMKGEV